MSSTRNQNRVTPDQYDPSQDRSPIRTLSEDRLHVSLRLGSLREPDEPMESIPIAKKRTMATNSSAPLLSSKVDGPSHTDRREGKSPVQAIGVKGRRVTKTQYSPRRKILQDATTSGKTDATVKSGQQPRMKLILATKKKITDFRSGPAPLPWSI